MGKSQLDSLMLAAQKDPVWWVKEVLGVSPWSRQAEIMYSVRDHKYTCVQSGHNVGKTFITACICLWFLSCFPDAVVLTTANGWAQVKGVLWEEIRKLSKRSKYPLGITFKPKHPEGRIGDNWAFGFSPDKPDSVQGHHRDHILIVLDEAQGIQDTVTWDAFSSMMTSSGAKQLAIGNPLYANGPFRQRFKDPKWSRIRLSCLEHPNYVSKRQIVPGALSYESIEEIRQDPLRGPGTLYWDTRIDGVFPEEGEDTVIPEKWLMNCVNLPPHAQLLPGTYLGLDPAAFGSDKTVVVVLKNGRMVCMEEWRRLAPEKTVNRTLKIAARYNVPLRHINFDGIGGVGGAVKRAFDVARVPAHPVYCGQPPVGDWEYLFGKDEHLQFLNRRAELHWAMRRLFEEQMISLPPRFVQPFIMESCELRYGFNDSGKLWIESKDRKFKPRLNYSPDHNDALTLALARDQGLPAGQWASADQPSNHQKYDPKGAYGRWDSGKPRDHSPRPNRGSRFNRK